MADEHKQCAHCSSCPSCAAFLKSFVGAVRHHTETAIVQWLQTMAHTPSCGYETKGDLVRWQVIDGHRLPTVRDDMIDMASERKIEAHGVELVAFLANAMEPRTREMLAFSLAALQ